MKNVLFLNGSSKTEFYNNERNKYNGVTADSIFKDNNLLNKITRKLLLLSNSLLIGNLLGNWKNNIDSYDAIILSATNYSFLIYKYIRKKSKIRIIHWYWNPIITEINPDKIRSNDTDIFSFDESDCDLFNMKYIPTYYFSTIKINKSNEVYNIYFMGSDKGRLESLIELENSFRGLGLSVLFHITQSSKQTRIKYNYMPRIPYSSVLDGISKSRAILDIVQVGQIGLTQRPLEALFHKKKLITNNQNIMTYDFYYPENIFILGFDNLDKLKEFLEIPLKDVSPDLFVKYDFRNWIDTITN